MELLIITLWLISLGFAFAGIIVLLIKIAKMYKKILTERKKEQAKLNSILNLDYQNFVVNEHINSIGCRTIAEDEQYRKNSLLKKLS